MSIFDVKVPAVGESVQEGIVRKWHVKSGDVVKRDQVLVELETDKATVDIVAEAAGLIQLRALPGATVKVGDILAQIDSSQQSTASTVGASGTSTQGGAPAPASRDAAPAPASTRGAGEDVVLSPAARRVVAESGIDPRDVVGTGKGGRVLKEDAVQAASSQGGVSPRLAVVQSEGVAATAPTSSPQTGSVPSKRGERREPMSLLRRRIAERLVHAQRTAAMLTTFNDVDMTSVLELRKQYKDAFKEKYGTSLGFMGFFVKATLEALKAFPQINGWVDGQDLVLHDYYDLGVAVSTERGLVVPVLRDADRLSLPEIELKIAEFAKKARDGKITVDDMTGGTFTVSNGGVFGSLLSTPILNPPQSGILGMHRIEERPVVRGGSIVARPMMYLAMSYDHRIVDGREAVQFLVKIKERIEDPARLLLGV